MAHFALAGQVTTRGPLLSRLGPCEHRIVTQSVNGAQSCGLLSAKVAGLPRWAPEREDGDIRRRTRGLQLIAVGVGYFTTCLGRPVTTSAFRVRLFTSEDRAMSSPIVDPREQRGDFDLEDFEFRKVKIRRLRMSLWVVGIVAFALVAVAAVVILSDAEIRALLMAGLRKLGLL